MKIYNEFADWFHLLTHPDDYVGEAADYIRMIQAACPGARTLLELGSGGGNNAFHMKRAFTCTLTDVSPRMLHLSQSINPECEHVVGDMRTLRLGRLFDVVFVHDAVEYMTTTIADLSQAAATAFTHTRPGGVALFLPDGTRERFVSRWIMAVTTTRPCAALSRVDHRPESVGYRYEVDFAVPAERRSVHVVHDRHEHASSHAGSGLTCSPPQASRCRRRRSMQATTNSR